MLAIVDAPGFGEPVVFSSNAASVKGSFGGCVHAGLYVREAAGRAFFSCHEATSSTATSAPSSAKKNASSDDADEEEFDMKGSKTKGQTLKISDLLKDVNLYKLMDVSEAATEADLKKAYRALALSSHPDKLASKPEEEQKEIQENFVKIQEAYAILSDPSKRQLYDSSLPFDEKIPKFKPDGDADFFEVFDEVFKRNARFSSKRPVPELGGPETPIADVKKFYDFWFAFQSWRDPLTMAEAAGEELEDMENAEDRYERRWIMKENVRIGKKYVKAEKERVSLLAATAEKNDPRLLAEKNSKKEAHAAEKRAKEEERMAVQRAKEDEERKRQEAEAAVRAAEEAVKSQAKDSKEAAKQEVKKQRQRLRRVCTPFQARLLQEQLDEVCVQFDRDALEKLGDCVEAAIASGSGGVAAAVAAVHAAISSLGLTPVVPAREEEPGASKKNNKKNKKGGN